MFAAVQSLSVDSRTYGWLKGALAAVPTLGIAALLPHPANLDFFAVLLGVTAGVYLGFSFLEGKTSHTAMEIAGVVFFLALALAGLHFHPWIIAAGFFLHILWDLAHHPRGIRTATAPWYPPACVVYDALVGAFILYWWR